MIFSFMNQFISDDLGLFWICLFNKIYGEIVGHINGFVFNHISLLSLGPCLFQDIFIHVFPSFWTQMPILLFLSAKSIHFNDFFSQCLLLLLFNSSFHKGQSVSNSLRPSLCLENALSKNCSLFLLPYSREAQRKMPTSFLLSIAGN